jgi:hypothetical protein
MDRAAFFHKSIWARYLRISGRVSSSQNLQAQFTEKITEKEQ